MRNLIYIVLPLLLAACRTVPVGPPVVDPLLYEIDNNDEPQGEEAARPQVQRMVETIAPYKAQLDERMNRVLAQVASPLRKGSPESTLGNWVADLTQAVAVQQYPNDEIAFSVLNSGGLRVNEINAGPLLVSEVYELMPFDNELVLLELSGKEVREFVSHVANSGGWPISRELTVDGTAGTLKVNVNGRPVDPEAFYTIALPDYVANGGSDSAMLVGKAQRKSGQRLRDLWLEYLERAGGTIEVVSDGSRFKLPQ